MKDWKRILENPGFCVETVRKDFDYLQLEPSVVYLDNAATTQRPRPVIERVCEFMKYENANPLRGNHRLSMAATDAYENARERVRAFIGAKKSSEIIFTRNATEAMNLVAYAWGLSTLKPGDVVLITRMEHHSNSVNWQFICQKTGAKLVYVAITEDYQLDLKDYAEKLTSEVKMVAFSGTSNVLSCVPDAARIIRMAHEKGALTLMDGAQLVPHDPVNVTALDCDFLAFSGHKMLAPFGIGVLYGKQALLEAIPPFLLGGEMIEYVYDEHSTYAELPYKFEAGTQNVNGAVGLHAAIDYMENIGMENISAYERALGAYCVEQLQQIPGLEIYHPTAGNRGAAVAFNFTDVHPHDVSTILDNAGVAIRSGHHCTQQLHAHLGIHASCRASFAFYNTPQEVDAIIEAMKDIRPIMGLA